MATKTTKKAAPKKAAVKKATAKVSKPKATPKKTSAPKAPAAPKPTTPVVNRLPATTSRPSRTEFEIENDAAWPAPTRSYSTESIYPFADLEVNQSFPVRTKVDPAFYTSDEEAGKALREDLKAIANRMTGAIRRYTKKNPDKKFGVRTVEDEFLVRVKRLA